jgi:formylglycine-generating enzyme required for sulfatase activity
MKILLFLVLIGICVLGSTQRSDANSPPVVSNAHAEQMAGTKLVEITYDVEDPDGDSLMISVQVSDDGGVTFSVPALTFVGDIGSGIKPGRGKRIIWDAGKDVPNTYGTNYRAKVIADDRVVEEIGSMVLIPAGEFLMGDAFLEGELRERPQHTVYLDAFYIDRYEVTNADFQRFVQETGYRTDAEKDGWGWAFTGVTWEQRDGASWRAPRGSGSGIELDHPVVQVSWNDAMAYAQWAGKRLPTEAEWEKAARGGLGRKRYPWGDAITHDDANYWEIEGRDQWTYTSPVGSFPPNGYGLYDVAGNVWEWCADRWGETYYSQSPNENPTGPVTGHDRVVRSGSWGNPPYTVRVASRFWFDPTYRNDNVGFRCAKSLIP